MIYLALIVAMIPVGLISFLAVSKKTSPAVRKAAFIALIVIALAFGTCSIILFILLGEETESEGQIVLQPVQNVETNQDLSGILIFLLVMVVFILMMIIASHREKRRKKRL